MKRKLILLFTFILSAFMIDWPAAVLPVYNAMAAEEEYPRGRLMVGEMITCSSVQPSAAKVVANNRGMSGLGSYIHLHNTTQSNSYKTEYANKRGAIVFTLPRIEALGYMYIWNYNVTGHLEDGMKDVVIQYSFDKTNWYNLKDGNFQLAKALESENVQYGGNAANNLNDGYRTPIDFGGLAARYVRIIPKSNYGGTGYGLSEVRFFRYKTRPQKGSLIYGTSRAPKSGVNAINLTNNYGLSDLTSPSATHTNKPETMWLSPKSAEDSFVVINLDGTYPVDKLYIWNYNDPQNLQSGMRRVKIEYTTKQPYKLSDSGIDYSSSDDAWTVLGEYEIPIGTGEANMPYSLKVDCGNVQMQHIRITPLDNHGGTGFGLSAVRAFAGTGWAVEPSRDWAQLFSSEGSFDYQTSGVNRTEKSGWIQADGIYTVNMNGADRPGSANSSTKTVFMFSDTLLGNMNDFSGTVGQYGKTVTNRGWRNNTFATLVGNKPDPRNFQFYLNPANSTESILGNGNWAQEMVRIGDKLHAWSFKFQGWTAEYYMFNTFNIDSSGFPSFNTRPTVSDAPFLTKYTENGRDYSIEFSNAILDNTQSGGATPNPDGYIYMYGLKCYTALVTIKHSVVARVRPEDFTDVRKWRYWNGSDWVADIKQCASLDDDGMVSSEYSVTYMEEGPFAGKYVMTFTNFTMSTRLAIMVSDSLTGPFNKSTKIALYDCPDALNIRETMGDKGIYTYNAKAHPHLSAKGELLISYNLNSSNFDSMQPFEYLHPQFVTLFEVKETQTADERLVYNDGENLAIGAAASADSTKTNSSPANAIDGNPTTAWTSNVTVGSSNGNAAQTYLTVDLGQKKTVNKLVLRWGAGRAKQTSDGYRAMYSEDGVNWSELNAVYRYGSVRQQGAVSYATDVIKFDDMQARYFKIFINNAASSTTPGIRELEVYREQSQTAPQPETFTPVPLKVGAPGEVDADFTALSKQIDAVKAAGLLQSNYTKESWDALQTALIRAQAMLDAYEATQEEVDAMTAQLQAAFSGLVKVTPPEKPKPKNGWVTIKGKEYYYKNDVLQKNAWITTKGKTYRTDSKGAKIKSTKWINVKDNRYRLVKGVRQENKILKIGSARYYVAKNGVLQKNKWIKYKKKWYRASKSGKLYQGKTVKIGKKKYRFNKNAVCLNK